MIRNRLKSLRHKNEMNQKEFADLVGFRPEQINRWELQKVQPTVENAFKICHVLNIKLEDLFEYSPE